MTTTIGTVQIMPVDARTLRIFIAPTTDEDGVAITPHIEHYVALLREANDLGISNGVPPQFESVMMDCASRVYWLSDRRIQEPKPPAGGGYLYFTGWDVFNNDAKLGAFMRGLGAVHGSTSAWCVCKGQGGGSPTELFRITVSHLSKNAILRCPQGVKVYWPAKGDKISLAAEEAS